MNKREMNFIRSTARGILAAMDDLKAEIPEQAIVAALADMTKTRETPLKSSEVAYYAVMYLAAHDWQIPD